MNIIIHSQAEINKARMAGKAASRLLKYIEEFIKPGVSTQELNDLAEEWTKAEGARSGPLNYKGTYPSSICTSINDVVCHGIPNEKDVLTDGDIVNVDVTPVLDGWHGDTSKTYIIGDVPDRIKNLVSTTKDALDMGIKNAKPGNTLGDIGHSIQDLVEKRGFHVVKEYVGHGTGRIFHTDPPVFHFGKKNDGLVLVPGMIFTIEPMVNESSPETKSIGEWVAVTADGGYSAQFEHTILITNDGCEVLTQYED